MRQIPNSLSRSSLTGALFAPVALLLATTHASGGELAHWRFEEAGGATVLDVGPGGFDGTLNLLPVRAMAVSVDPVPQSEFANAQSLDLGWVDAANGGYLVVDDPAGFLSPGAGSFTVEAWVKLDELADAIDPAKRQLLVQKKPLLSAGEQLDLGFLVQAGTFGTTGRELCLRYGDTAVSSQVLSSLEINDLGWHHVSLAYDAVGQQLRFGLDGVFDTHAFTKPSAVNGGPFIIGAHENAVGVKNWFLRGSIDEVRYTDLFLDPSDMLDAVAIDCDISGTSDFAEVLLDLVQDCNRNWVPDSCDFASGTSQDCQLDGIPDDCQLMDFLYAWHSADGDATVGSDGIYTAWLDSFEVKDGMSTLTHVDVWISGGFGALGTDMTVYIWSDPDGDGDPTDAQVLSSLGLTVTAGMIDRLNRFDLPDTFVGPDGTRFFVGAVGEAAGVSGAAYDISDLYTPGSSWIIGRDTPIDPNDLSFAAVEFAPLENQVPFTGNWILSGVIAATEEDCNQNGVPDACDLASATSVDDDMNGVPDECEVTGVVFVPDHFGNIQTALNVVLPGSVIVVRPGTYLENIDFNGKPVTLRSERGPSLTTIDGGASGSVVTFRTGEGPDSVIEGFTITGGLAVNGGGVFCSDASPTIRRNVITGNEAQGAGGGIVIIDASDAIVEGNEISNNLCDGEGAGIGLFLGNSFPTIMGNTIRNNTSTGGSGGGVFSQNGSPLIENNRIVSNSVPNSGGGVMMIFSAGVPQGLVRNHIAGNSAGDDGGGVWASNTLVDLADNVIAGNSSAIGAGLYLRDQTAALPRNTVVDNSATVAGGGVYFDGGNATTVASWIVRDNTAPVDPQIALNGDPVVFDYCDVEGGWPGTGNIDIDPEFVDADGPDDDPATPMDNDYRLLGTSPCVDFGDPSDLPCPALDAGGNPRLLDGMLLGTWRVDMGAHEFDHVQLSLLRAPVQVAARLRSLLGFPSGIDMVLLQVTGTPGLTVDVHVSPTRLDGCSTQVGATYYDPGDDTVYPNLPVPSVRLLMLPEDTEVLQGVTHAAPGSNTSNPILR